MAQRNWKPIAAAERGLGPLPLRAGSGVLDPVYVGFLSDDGRWLDSATGNEMRPLYCCVIPVSDADDEFAA